MRWSALGLGAALAISGQAQAQTANCVASDGAGPRQSTCLSADAAGAHLRAESPTSPRLDVTVGGHTAFVVDPIGVTFAEPGAPAISGFSPLITLNETNLANNNKHGLRGVLYTDNTAGMINANLLALDIFTPPDNGGDVSGAWIRQTGGGNALSIFNICGERPKGFRAYCGNGFALEAQVDGTKNSVFASAVDGSALLAVVKGASGTGLAVFPSEDTSPEARAIHVATADNSRENFFVEMSGRVFARRVIQTEGGVLAYNTAPGGPVYHAIAGQQAAYFADVQHPGAIGFFAKPASAASTTGTAFLVQSVEGRDLARVGMDGEATFKALAVGGEPIHSVLRATTAPLGGSPLENGRCARTSIPVPGAATSMAVIVSPAEGVDPGDGFFVQGLVSIANVVVVKICNATVGSATPKGASYVVRVIP